MTDILKLRSGKIEDLNFILSSWLRSYRIAPAYKGVSNEVYYGSLRPLAMRILELSDVTIACASDDEDQILGFIVHRRQFDIPVVSFLYVKHSHRRMRIADRLFQQVLKPGDDVSFATHSLPWLEDVMSTRNIVFNPFLDLEHLEKTL